MRRSNLCGPDRSSSNTKRGYSTTTSAKRPGFRERAEDHRHERRLAEQSLLHRARRGRHERREKTNPDAKLTVVSSDYDLGKQFSQMDNFIAAGVDLILVAADDPQTH